MGSRGSGCCTYIRTVQFAVELKYCAAFQLLGIKVQGGREYLFKESSAINNTVPALVVQIPIRGPRMKSFPCEISTNISNWVITQWRTDVVCSLQAVIVRKTLTRSLRTYTKPKRSCYCRGYSSDLQNIEVHIENASLSLPRTWISIPMYNRRILWCFGSLFSLLSSLLPTGNQAVV